MRTVVRLLLAALTAFAWLFVVDGETPVFAQACNTNYAGTCIPPGVDNAVCANGTADGRHVVEEKNIRVVGRDEFGLDLNGNRIACEDTDLAQPETTPTAVPRAAPTTAPTTTAPSTTTTTRPATSNTTAPRTTPTTAMPNTGVETDRQTWAAVWFVLVGLALLIGSTMRERLRME